MIVAKNLVIYRKDGSYTSYVNLSQIYTIGNFITVSGFYHNDNTVPVVDKFMINDLKSMSVSFDGKS